MNADQAKRLDLKDLLARLGHEPQRHDRAKGEWWYLSPFRPEKEPSFHIKYDPGTRKWFYNDFGEGGGNVIDFAMAYWRIGFREALRELARYDAPLPLFGPAARPAAPRPESAAPPQGRAETPTLAITGVGPLFHYALKNYLQARGIPPAIAGRYVREARFTLRGRENFALAFPNDAGGYELRNALYKGSSAPKEISLIPLRDGAADGATAVFEGFMDFLSAMTMNALPDDSTAALVLNSATLRERALARLAERGGPIYLYLDHDATGRMLTAWFQERLAGRRVLDHSGLYLGHADFNAMLQAKQAQHR